MTRTRRLTVALTSLLCVTLPALAQNSPHLTGSDLVFVPQVKPGAGTKAKPHRHRIRREVAGKATAAPAARASGQSEKASSAGGKYGDWIVNCILTDGAKACTVSQAQINKDTGQRVFGIELRISKGGSGGATILMPFGLKLENGLVIKVDNEEQRLPFSTCLTQGCLVTVALPDAAITAIRKAKTFTVSAMSFNGNQVISFNVSLSGIEAALEHANKFVD